MTIRLNIVVAAASALTLAAGLGGCASASGAAAQGATMGGPIIASGPAADGVLDELPAHPPAGTCYARVKVISDGPPPGARAVWRQNPGLPGAMGPTWCLVLENGQIAPPPPERFGWVKVLCDVDATPERVRTIQSRLQGHGDYQGEVTGHYDQATADAVARFQQEEHIDHGGYLSLTTVEAIERAEVRAAAASGGPIHVACCQTPAPPPPPPPPIVREVPVPYPVRVEVPVPQPYPVRVEVPVPQPYPVEVRVPQPYPVRVEVPVPQPYPVQVAVPQPYPVYIQVQQPCCMAPPPQPCCVAPPMPQPCCQAPGGYGPGYGGPGPGYGGQGYGRAPGYEGNGPTMGRDAAGFLTWAGKSAY